MSKVLKFKCRISLYILKDKKIAAQKQVKSIEKEDRLMTIIINKKNLVCSPTHLVVTRPLLATPENAHSPLTYNINFINTS
jgi:hypothetical protein